ncbi:MAG: PLP-dependent aminotransferase family protein [Candidatus Eisenbacteria bacterium]|nr:PLP-dependent aminotransferase family protein [Candidatus Eisenbacteria bacterium]
MEDLETRFAARARGKEPSPIRELLKFLKIDGMISLGGGYPNPGTFVFDRIDVRFRDGAEATIAGAELTTASQYGASDAHTGLRDEIIAWHRGKDGVELDSSRLVVLNGSQEGLFIMAYLFADPDDSIALSEPAYPGALSAFRSFTRNFVAVPLDEHGMDTVALESRLTELEHRGLRMPKFIYTVPSGHNPGGVALSVERRKHMIDIAGRFDLLILEDDPYQLVKLDDSPVRPTLQSLDQDGRVIRLDSFSKVFAPGLRIGYASGSAEIVRQFVLFKQSSNLHTSTFIQAILHTYMTTAGHDAFRSHIRRNCAFYRTNRDAMIEGAKAFLPDEVRYNVPAEGMFIWFVLPQSCDARRMIDEQCEDLKVLLVPGGAFSTRGELSNCMRASFSMVSPEQIREGMRRFGEMIRREMKRQSDVRGGN